MFTEIKTDCLKPVSEVQLWRKLKFEELKDMILKGCNYYEKENNIKTINVSEIIRVDDIALFISEKSDNTKTLFVAFRCKRNIDSWFYLAPTENQKSFLKLFLPEFYTYVDNKNTIDRNIKK